MDIVMIGILLTPLALASGSLIVWGIVGLCLASPFVSLLLGPFLRPRR
jgi:hypothetical protein